MFIDWLATTQGRNLLHFELEIVNSMIAGSNSSVTVILGERCFEELVTGKNIRHKFTVNATDQATVRAREDKLPIASDSVDVVYLAHCLEFSNNPQEVLGEAYRILRPDGRLIISILKPYNLTNILHSISWRTNFISLARLRDWLALLGFDIMQTKHLGYAGSNVRLEKYAQKLKLPLSKVSVVEATKFIIPVTPIKPVWSSEAVIAAEDLTQPTT